MRIVKILTLIILFWILFSPITIILGKLTATKNIVAEADAYIDLDSNANYGGDNSILVVNSEYSDYIGIIRFDLMSIFNSTISSATLKLKTFIVYETNEIGIHSCSDISWNELTINSIPSYTQTALDTTLVASGGKWYLWDVTTAVNSSFPNEKITFVIKAMNQIEGISLGVRMYSRELNMNSFIPKIKLQSGHIVYDFDNAGSGGKKTLLKVCYALALHETTSELNRPLPNFLIIDTPMKNIGELDEDIFRAFYEKIYDLSKNGLQNTQLVIIDKKYFGPLESTINIYSEHMDPENNPLISTYRESSQEE